MAPVEQGDLADDLMPTAPSPARCRHAAGCSQEAMCALRRWSSALRPMILLPTRRMTILATRDWLQFLSDEKLDEGIAQLSQIVHVDQIGAPGGSDAERK